MSSNSPTQIQKLYEDLQYLKKEKLEDSSKYQELFSELNKLIEKVSPDESVPLESATFEARDNPILTEQQLFQLKNQLLAFKHLTVSQNIPKNILSNIGTLTPNQWENLKNEKLNSCVDIEEIRKKKIEFMTNRMVENSLKLGDACKDKNINKIMSSVEAFSQTYLDKRKSEIDLLISSGLVSKKSQTSLEMEKMFLEVFPTYNRIKKEIFGDINKFLEKKKTVLPDRMYYDRNFYKRAKPKRKYEKKMEMFELQIKHEQIKRRKEKHKKYLDKIFSYNSKIKTYFRKKKKTLKKISNNVKLRHEWLAKKNIREVNNDNKKRTEALRAEKYEEYRTMLLEAKDKRIFEILQETDNYLKEIVSKVVSMKQADNDTGFQLQDENSEWLNLKKSNDADDYDVNKSTMLTQNYQKYYFNLTHTNVEEVKEQPSLLEGGTLKSYQLIGLQWMVSLYNNKLNGILADEMGLGKTIQTIALFCYIMEFKQNYGPFLVVVPLTTLPNWVMEFEKWAPTIKKIIYNGDQASRKAISYKMKNTKWNVCITTYEFVLRDKSDLGKFHWKYIIVDEGHKMKNPKSKFAQTLGQVYKSDYRILLTGTPLQNNLPELWALLNFLLPKVFSSCEDFERWFKLPMKNFGNEKDIVLNEEEQLLIIRRFHHVLRPFLLRRIKKEVENELPNKVEFVMMVELSAWQRIVYDQISRKESTAVDPNSYSSGKKNKVLMNMMMQLRKICDHPYLFLEGGYNVDDDLLRASGKFELLDRILPKLIHTGHRLLLFTQMTRLMDILEVFLEYKGFKYLRLDGTTKAEDRAYRMMQFNQQNSPFPIFILSTRAGGLGLNLQTADTVVLIDSDWNPQMDAQAQDRAHRIGQTREVRVYRLITNTVIEKAILSKASYKKSLDEMVIQTGLFNQKSTEQERRNKIEELIKTQNDDEFDEDEVTNDLEINKMLARNEEELVIFTRMDKERYERDKKVYPNFRENTNYRLMTYDQVPSWVKQKTEMKKKPLILGKRMRKRVKKFDYMDDDEFFDRIENENQEGGESFRGASEDEKNGFKNGKNGKKRAIEDDIMSQEGKDEEVFVESD